MGTIDTFPSRSTASSARYARSIRVGTKTYESIDTVPFRVWFQVVFAMIKAKRQKRVTRHELSTLSSDMLADIGITEAQADEEIRRSYPLYRRTDHG